MILNHRQFALVVGITIVMVFLRNAQGHFSVLVPDRPAARKGQPVQFRYFAGHPFECQIVDTQPPARASVLLPEGKERVELELRTRSVDNFDGGKVTIQTFTFAPEVRGDHLVLLTTPLHFDEHAGGFLQDEVKLNLRVQVQRGWDQAAGTPIELLPLTRPYGLPPGVAFRVRAVLDGRPLADAEVEVERLNSAPPKEIPDDDALITRVVKTDINGYAVATLDEPGWWGLMATAEDGTKERDGKKWPIIRRAILWVYVGDGSAGSR